MASGPVARVDRQSLTLRSPGHFAVVAATRLPAGGCDDNAEAPAALDTEPRRLELAATGPLTWAVGYRAATPAAMERHITLESDPIGILRSSSIARSSSGDLPSVVK